MEPEIKITANVEPTAPETCKFVIDRPVYPQGIVVFPSKENAQGSPLAEKLFALPEVTLVRIAGNTVSVTKSGPSDWQAIARQIGETLRQHIRSGALAVSPEFQTHKPQDDLIKTKVQEIFDTQINPAVAQHGGHVELIEVKDGVVFVQMGGGCQGCGMADVTLRQGIESAVREQIPEVVEILDVTDHAAGANPFFTPSKK